MVPNRNGIDVHRLSQIVDRELWFAEQGLENPVFRAFHDENSIPVTLSIVNILEKYHKY